MLQHSHAVLALADGTILRGISIGAKGISTGEVVFNTAMTVYQEILSDPSYCKQIVTLTFKKRKVFGSLMLSLSVRPMNHRLQVLVFEVYTW